MIDEISLEVSKIEIQKAIVKQLYNKNDITLNQYNLVISKFDKKIHNLLKKRKQEDEDKLQPIIMQIKL